jgi:predicted N-acetyltransferase YhbS
MIILRNYKESDTRIVGQLIADTYSEFNLSFASPEDRRLMLGPFRHAQSSEPEHQKVIAEVLRSPIFLVADIDGKIIGVLRGRKERLASLFVYKDFHYQGIGRMLVEEFEKRMLAQHAAVIRVASTLYAVPFYAKMGYKKSTGVRLSWSFDGHGLPYQPMKKELAKN